MAFELASMREMMLLPGRPVRRQRGTMSLCLDPHQQDRIIAAAVCPRLKGDGESHPANRVNVLSEDLLLTSFLTFKNFQDDGGSGRPGGRRTNNGAMRLLRVPCRVPIISRRSYRTDYAQ